MSALVGYQLVRVGEALARVERPLPEPAPGQVRVRVAGCGLCHTDVGFAVDGVRTRHPLPLILGHEVSGVVEAAGAGDESLVGQPVVVPAVIPCGDCDDSRAGASMICKRLVMPGYFGPVYQVAWDEQELIGFLAAEGFVPAPRLVLERALS